MRLSSTQKQRKDLFFEKEEVWAYALEHTLPRQVVGGAALEGWGGGVLGGVGTAGPLTRHVIVPGAASLHTAHSRHLELSVCGRCQCSCGHFPQGTLVWSTRCEASDSILWASGTRPNAKEKKRLDFILFGNACLVVSNSLNTTDCNPPGSSVHGILQAKILECFAISSSRESSQPRDQTRISCISCVDRRTLPPHYLGLHLFNYPDFIFTSQELWMDFAGDSWILRLDQIRVWFFGKNILWSGWVLPWCITTGCMRPAVFLFLWCYLSSVDLGCAIITWLPISFSPPVLATTDVSGSFATCWCSQEGLDFWDFPFSVCLWLGGATVR